LQLNTYRMIDLLLRHAASSDQREMDGLEAQIAALHEANSKGLEGYEALPSDALELALYGKVKADQAALYSNFEDIRRLSRIATPAANAQAAALIDNHLRPLAATFSTDLQAVVDYNNKGSVDGLALSMQSGNAAKLGILLGLGLCIAVSIPVTLFIVRGITGPLGMAVAVMGRVAEGDLTATLDVHSRDEVGQMATALNEALEKIRSTLLDVTASAASATTSSQELAAATDAIASGAQEQAASLEQTAASLEQITAAVRQSADNAKQASQLASGSRDTAERGQDVVVQAITAMSEINAASAKIADIISTIDEIAFQTNLLAVNAAVEAARAGEEGRGFAVVASEVRSLAQRSAGAAKEIKGLIQDSLKKVERGTELVNKSGETLHGIVGSVKRVTDIVGEIAAAAGEQSSGIEQVNTAMTQMDRVTQCNSAQTEELSSTAQSLSEQSARLMELVSTFVLSKGGREPRSLPESRQMPSSTARPAARKAASGVRTVAARVQVAAGPGKSVLAAVPAGGDDSSFEEF
jgi:methyl-accepting chemotaxis protein